jgi:hypothetical protein
MIQTKNLSTQVLPGLAHEHRVRRTISEADLLLREPPLQLTSLLTSRKPLTSASQRMKHLKRCSAREGRLHRTRCMLSGREMILFNNAGIVRGDSTF